MSAVMQRGLDLLRHEMELRETKIDALRVLVDARRNGDFVSLDDGFAKADALIAERRASRGL